MTFKKTALKANQTGSLKIIVPHDATGPNGEEIDEGDEIVFDIVAVNKRGQ